MATNRITNKSMPMPRVSQVLRCSRAAVEGCRTSIASECKLLLR